MHDFLIVGAGVVGLSLAWELAARGRRVLVVDRSKPVRSTSWVGAGILPPPQRLAAHDPLEQLRTYSHDLHLDWSRRLREETGIDNELRRCGGIYLARHAAEAVSLRVAMQQARDDGVVVQELTSEQLVGHEVALETIAAAEVQAAFRLPDEMQLRSPCHLKALVAACRHRGVDLRSNTHVRALDTQGDRVAGAITDEGRLQAANYCLTGGPWTPLLMDRLGWNLPIEPMRGQLIVWKTANALLSHVINEGHRYLVPRRDGHLVAGATVEDVGFECTTTEDAIAELSQFSLGLLPKLRDQSLVGAWAGLRPTTPDGQPFLGRVPGVANLSVAAGHHRSGLHLAPATGHLMAQLLSDERTDIDLGPFRLGR